MTKEEILNIEMQNSGYNYLDLPLHSHHGIDITLKAMQAYADQQTAELRAEVERLKEVIMFYDILTGYKVDYSNNKP